jgi:hypothetical protein
MFMAQDKALQELSAATPNYLPDVSKRFKNVAEALIKPRNGEWELPLPELVIPILDKNLTKHKPLLVVGGVIKLSNMTIVGSSISVSIAFVTGRCETAAPAMEINRQSCCLPLCEDRLRIVRRFHFDFQPNEKGKPQAHLQYGGVFQRSAFPHEVHYCLEHFLETPRIPYFPMDFVLVLDMFIRNFNTPLSKWKTESRWRKLVKESEQFWLKKYMNDVALHLNSTDKQLFHEREFGSI